MTFSVSRRFHHSMKTIPALKAPLLLGFAALVAIPAFAQQQPISNSVKNQISQILAVKDSFSAGEKKLSSNLAFASRQAHGKSLGTAPSLAAPNIAGTDGRVQVVIRGNANPELLSNIAARGGKVDAVAPSKDRIEARVPLLQLEGLATRPDVGSIRQPPRARTNAGSLTTQGYVSHLANQVVEGAIPVTGSGVKVGVLSDSASPARVTALIGSGDLGPLTTVLANQSGSGSDEGTAMMEIVQDIAPDSQLFFATAFTSEASFASNIFQLGVAGCFVIVDDVLYSDEDPFQDSTVARAVNTFVDQGGIYFSAAGNAGNITNNNATAWEGDFTDGGILSSGPIFATEGPVFVHDFGGGTTFNQLRQTTDIVDLFWADPLGGSTNDYDLFILNSAGTIIKGSSTSAQTGFQDAYEEVAIPPFGNYTSPASNDRIVIVRKISSARVALHVETFGQALLSISTTGAAHGHNAGSKTESMAATYWNSARNGTTPFDGTNNPTETFSSDGPRKIFFNPNGSPITPGNFLFATGGGQTLQKPDFSAADGVTTATPGFNPFFGTSAAAPHGAGIAALIKSANPSLTNSQIHQLLVDTAMDMGSGPNSDGGFGVLNAKTAVESVP